MAIHEEVKMNITIQQNPNLDVTTIKVKLKYPTNYFDLHVWDFCPYSLKTQLAFEYKFLAYPDLEYSITQIYPYSYSVLKRLEAKTGFSSVPQIKIQYKQGLEETWLGDSTTIVKLLDSVFPENSLFHSENSKINFEVNVLEDWIDEAFKMPYNRLLFLNKNNLQKATKKWTEEEDSLINKARLEIFKKERSNYYATFCHNKDKALNEAYKRLDEELLPWISDRLENNNEQGIKFLVCKEPTIADLSLYSFFKLILRFEEANLITRRSTLQKYLENLENIPLGKVHGSVKKGYTRQKISLLEAQKKEEEQV